ncbi:conserved hypothetical protein [Nitrosomonas nitrosa]|uniref:Phenylacetate-CoA ligase n=1 Tax=Nitrosomonas nitrosa TaxID=52442 RepID=A0A8H8YXY7_9PROT|nr:hypothetical protein [Nitrosomonas nitrosa]CAE6483277.1 conserved hypothetical protein [Nitrosomonas nitrosa]
MSVQSRLKNFAENLPEFIGRPLANVPFALRLGPAYQKMRKEIARTECNDLATLNNQRFMQMRSLLSYVYEKVAFYREFYQRKGFFIDEFCSLNEWKRVPIVTKADLQGVPLAARLAQGAKGFKINTGGTSGQPLEFYLDEQAFAREWAHMHYIWKARGYRQQHLKLTLRGKHFDRSQPLRYNAVHNEYVVNANCTMSQAVESVLALPRSTLIRWIHGYPSLVAEFAHALVKYEVSRVSDFRARLFGVLLGSEYPAPVYRTVIEQVLSSNVVSWYGHSEMSILAREVTRDVYASLPSYGYAEAVPVEGSSDSRLICTSLYNRVHPFIRYDTGDLIVPISHMEGSLAFRISEGRVGDFVLDRHGNKHALTAIIFGRHHSAFEYLQHLQVRDEGHGRITLVVTPRDSAIKTDTLMNGFDLNDLDIDWRLQIVNEPIRTQAGKIRLKIDP